MYLMATMNKNQLENDWLSGKLTPEKVFPVDSNTVSWFLSCYYIFFSVDAIHYVNFIHGMTCVITSHRMRDEG